jgi:hypothetical protein
LLFLSSWVNNKPSYTLVSGVNRGLASVKGGGREGERVS